MNSYVEKVLNDVKERYATEPEFVQAVTEVLTSVEAYVDMHPEFEEQAILERFVEPERIIRFRVPWLDDNNKMQINRAYRVQFSNAIGPYKGGMRLHPSVNMGILKFLGFEQVFKNSLTGLPLGGGKGGSDFDPKGKSDAEVMRFCQSLMNELYKYMGPGEDVPAGDIGTGAREIGYMFGQYKRLKREWGGSLTGKGLSYGGSLARKEATGFGLVYFVNEYLAENNDSFAGKKVLVSGSGNVATYAAQKAQELGATVITMSDSNGFIYDEAGIDLDIVKQIKEVERGRISEYADRKPSAQYFEGERPWRIAADIALPCATQNEINADNANDMVKNGVKIVAEGANMPTDAEALKVLLDNNIVFMPGKAANAGGVATSGLEMAQNAQGLSWSFEKVDEELHNIMKNIYKNCSETAKELNCPGNFVVGANVAGFKRVAEAMMAQGAV